MVGLNRSCDAVTDSLRERGRQLASRRRCIREEPSETLAIRKNTLKRDSRTLYLNLPKEEDEALELVAHEPKRIIFIS